MRVRALAAALLVSASTALVACGDDEDKTASSSTPAPAPTTVSAECTAENLATKTAGKLTIATGKPASAPYFKGKDPKNGKGFESAVAYAIADALGFDKSDVTWKTVPLNAALRPGEKAFDFDVNQVSITDKRKQAVDVSAPYFTAPHAVLALSAAEAASATKLSQLKDLTLGAQAGTTSLDAVKAVIKPSVDPQVFNSADEVVSALEGGRVNAIVVDLPTALRLNASELESAKVVGQFEAEEGVRWGAVLAKDSTLTPCIDQAIGKLRAEGTLDKLQKQWIDDATKTPELT